MAYKRNAAAISDVVASCINAILDGGNAPYLLIKEGKLRAFGISSAHRSAAFPDIPTLAEQGLPQCDCFVYMGLLAPDGTPKDFVQRLAKALKAAQASDAVKERFRTDGAEPGRMSPEEFTHFLLDDSTRMQKVVTDRGYAKE